MLIEKMNTRRKNAQSVAEENVNEEVTPPTPQNPQVPIEEGAISNVDIRAVIHRFNKVFATQVCRNTRVQVIPNSIPWN